MSIQCNYVPVFVQTNNLAAVYRYAAELEERGLSAVPAEMSQTDRFIVDGWTREQIELLYRESPAGMKAVLDGMIDRPDEDLDAGDLLQFLQGFHNPDADGDALRGTMGAFAHRCSSRYGRSRFDFPFEHRYIEGGFARYQMPTLVADVLRPLRDGTGDDA